MKNTVLKFTKIWKISISYSRDGWSITDESKDVQPLKIKIKIKKAINKTKTDWNAFPEFFLLKLKFNIVAKIESIIATIAVDFIISVKSEIVSNNIFNTLNYKSSGLKPIRFLGSVFFSINSSK